MFLISIATLVVYCLQNTVSQQVYVPRHCQDPSIARDGEYLIYPDGSTPVLVYCEVTKGWLELFYSFKVMSYRKCKCLISLTNKHMEKNSSESSWPE